MLEHSIYSVISPEGCASHPVEGCREDARGRRGAEADGAGSAEAGRDRPDREGTRGRRAAGPGETVEAVGKAVEAMLKELSGKKPEALVRDRREKFLSMGSKGLAA
jgi:acetyl-CoA carboxylase carboxyl transferase subunit alpha